MSNMDQLQKQMKKLEDEIAKKEKQQQVLKAQMKAETKKLRNQDNHNRGKALTEHLGDEGHLYSDEDIEMFLKHIFSLCDIQIGASPWADFIGYPFYSARR